MKLMKRILAIVCTFVMIISMATGVNAVENTSTTATSTPERGKITVTNAIAGEDYKIYKILSLESYDKTAGAFHIRNLVEIGIHLLTQMKVNNFLLQMKTVM